jgi:RNA polymerase sigma-70 factor (ECF subfamily)
VPLDELPVADIERGALSSDAPTPDRLAGSIEIRSGLSRALNLLEPILREAFHLRVIEELSYDEIAQVTAVPINTVKTRIFRAREQLQRLLVEYR